jgi:hypothetical protein
MTERKKLRRALEWRPAVENAGTSFENKAGRYLIAGQQEKLSLCGQPAFAEMF